MVYQGRPDWLTLHAVPVYDESGSSLTVGEITELLKEWEATDADIAELISGDPTAPKSVSALATGMAAAMAAAAAYSVAGGVVGNAAYDLIKLVVAHR